MVGALVDHDLVFNSMKGPFIASLRPGQNFVIVKLKFRFAQSLSSSRLFVSLIIPVVDVLL